MPEPENKQVIKMRHENVKRARSCKSRDGGSNTLLSTPANGRREHLNRQEAALGSPGASSSSSRPAPSVPTWIVCKQTSAKLFLKHTDIYFTRNIRISQALSEEVLLPRKGFGIDQDPEPIFRYCLPLLPLSGTFAGYGRRVCGCGGCRCGCCGCGCVRLWWLPLWLWWLPLWL